MKPNRSHKVYTADLEVIKDGKACILFANDIGKTFEVVIDEKDYDTRRLMMNKGIAV